MNNDAAVDRPTLPSPDRTEHSKAAYKTQIFISYIEMNITKRSLTLKTPKILKAIYDQTITNNYRF